jgi:hypothetical protein
MVKGDQWGHSRRSAIGLLYTDALIGAGGCLARLDGFTKGRPCGGESGKPGTGRSVGSGVETIKEQNPGTKGEVCEAFGSREAGWRAGAVEVRELETPVRLASASRCASMHAVAWEATIAISCWECMIVATECHTGRMKCDRVRGGHP